MFQSRDGSVSTLMADVAGNGPSAAAPVSDVRWLVRQHLTRGARPGEVLAAANEWLVGQDLHTQLVTALCVRIDVGSGVTDIASAGHLGPFLKRSSGNAESLTPGPALPLGILAREVYPETTLILEPEDVLVLVTDGVTDRFATPDDPLGERGTVKKLARSSRSIAQICDALLGPDATPGVDHTVVVLQMPPARPRSKNL